ncbi:MAG: isoprenylcysteine carboxylmethyltransferase family protein [Terriglobales bacterium]|jgi:protein-S-isoprenylcysteine O-methyltransferase Ste14
MDFATIKRVWLPLAIGLFGIIEIFRAHLGPYDQARWLGLGLSLIGLAGVIVARYTLGRSFSVKAKATAMVTTGIYSRIRNPIYVSGIVLFIGLALMLWKILMGGIAALAVPVQIVRARREAKVLEEKFADEYREYRKRTWF